MAIEDMYMSKDCLQGVSDVANGTKQGVMEELKATDMMRWIGLMNNKRACADQIVDVYKRQLHVRDHHSPFSCDKTDGGAADWRCVAVVRPCRDFCTDAGVWKTVITVYR